MHILVQIYRQYCVLAVQRSWSKLRFQKVECVDRVAISVDPNIISVYRDAKSGFEYLQRIARLDV